MKKIYSIFAGLMAAAFLQAASAAEWSYDWPVSATSDKNTGYANGFYNFSTSYDADITSMERTFNGKQWRVNFAAGAQLAYTSSGQSIGSAGKGTSYFTLVSDSFDGKIVSASIELKTKATDATIAFSVGDIAYGMEGETSVRVNSDNELHTYTFSPLAENEAAEGTVTYRFDAPSANTANYVKKITIVYEERVATLEAPVFTPAPGVFDEPIEVALSGPDGAEIIYTLDGSSPLAEGNGNAIVYSAPISILETTTIKAAARLGDDTSNIAEGVFAIRKPAGLSVYYAPETIELLEEGMILLDNPNNVSPINYSSSNPQVASADRNGHIYTFSLGEAVITANFPGNDEYQPQALEIPISVVAKEPVTGLTITPGAGSYEGPLTVNISCTDPRVETIWYNIGPTPSEVDELGILEYGQYTIYHGTDLTLTLDEDCVLSVQAMGYNLWSEAQFLEYSITTPLAAEFEADADKYEIVYHQGFDSMEEAETWTYSTGSDWSLEQGQILMDVPSFTVIDPESVYSLFHQYDDLDNTSVAASPAMLIPENAKLRFWMVFNPVWLIYGNIEIYACEEGDEAVPVKIWDAFLTSQEAATDDMKWTQYYVDLAQYAGKNIYFAVAYGTSGDSMIMDNFDVVVSRPATEVITITAGDTLGFKDLSLGHPQAWTWSFPGGAPATSSDQNPTVTYNVPGTYDVTLTVSRGAETSTLTKAGYVVVEGAAPTAGIGIPENAYYSPEAGLVVALNKEITFTDTSKGAPTSWLWSLPGTDLGTSISKDVTVKYTEAGMYDVDLTVSNDYGQSSTYIYGVKAGGESLIWNIPTADNDKLTMVGLGWYGMYGGTNWLDMEAFAEGFEAPMVPAAVSGVNVYFGAVNYDDPDGELTVSLMLPGEDGLPSTTLATSTLKYSQLVDASQTYNDPTWFAFDEAVEVNSDFFVSVAGFPNEGDNDLIAMYALMRQDGKSTAYHLLAEYDDYWQPTGESTWYKQEDEQISFAIAPKIEFNSNIVGVGTPSAADTETQIYNLQGIRVSSDREHLDRGIYLERRSGKTLKIKR